MKHATRCQGAGHHGRTRFQERVSPRSAGGTGHRGDGRCQGNIGPAPIPPGESRRTSCRQRSRTDSLEGTPKILRATCSESSRSSASQTSACPPSPSRRTRRQRSGSSAGHLPPGAAPAPHVRVTLSRESRPPPAIVARFYPGFSIDDLQMDTLWMTARAKRKITPGEPANSRHARARSSRAHRRVADVRVVPVPVSSSSRALTMTVPGVAQMAFSAVSVTEPAHKRSPGRIGPEAAEALTLTRPRMAIGTIH